MRKVAGFLTSPTHSGNRKKTDLPKPKQLLRNITQRIGFAVIGVKPNLLAQVGKI